MSSYHCPYCSPKYQFQKMTSDGTLVCGLCGDPVLKTVLVKPTQFFALVAILAFIAPLIIMIITFINGHKKPTQSQYNSPIASLIKD